MKKLASFLATAASLLLASPVLAQTSDFNNFPTSDAANQAAAAGVATGLGIMAIVATIFGIIMAVIGIVFFIWWILMLLDCLKRNFPQKNTWIILLVVSIFVGLYWLVTILYYFMVKRKNLGGTPATTPPAAK